MSAPFEISVFGFTLFGISNAPPASFPWTLVGFSSIMVGMFLGYASIGRPQLRSFLLQTSWVWLVAVPLACYRLDAWPTMSGSQLMILAWILGLTSVLKADEALT